MFSMTILPKEDADAEPVGESWDEPNENPFLKKPTAGRSLGDLLGGMGFDFNFDFNLKLRFIFVYNLKFIFRLFI